MTHRPKRLILSWRDWRRRLITTGGALAAIALVASGTAWALAGHPATGAGAGPLLTADTNAGCNAPQPAGFARCFAIVRTPADHRITADAAGPPPGALGPADIQSAYKLPATGGGQTVAIVDAFGDSTAESDLATFRAQYGLAPCTTANGCFTKVDQTGGTSYPPDDPGWALETSLDLDAVSAACPKCNILLVEGNTANVQDLGASADEAVTLGAKFVSNSYGAADQAAETGWDHYYKHPGVAVTASAGDGGYGVNYPSASRYVTAVGGTTLTKDTSVARGWAESVWGSSSGGAGTGSGCSAYEPQPGSQQGIPALDAVCKRRATADVSADASPQSGLAVYDTDGQSGWLQVGGTSLSSPLTAATFALAGPPQPGTFPNAYPYHDTSRSSDMFDVTQGANGSCGNPLCQAGHGWDGPTGLGTPHGVKAYTSGPQGQITGHVTNKATGKPIIGATVTAQPGGYVTRTDSSGNYDLSVTAGTYRTLTASDFGARSVTDSDVKVTANQTTTENFTLAASPPGIVSGTVTDGSGHGWPLHAQITVSGDPHSPFWTSPYTGKYRISLPQGSYTLTVSTDYPGYQARQVKVPVGARTAKGITLNADPTACTAPGYGPEGGSEDFTGWTGHTPQQGWAVSKSGGTGWRFDNPGDRPPPETPPHLVTGGDDTFAVADSGYVRSRMDTTLTSPAVNLSGQKSPRITFDSAYYAAPSGQSRAEVDLSSDGGRTWASVWHRASSNAVGLVTIAVPAAAGQPDVRFRFRYTGQDGWYWALDNVFLGTHGCVPLPGGLLAGAVTGRAGGKPVNGAQVTGPGGQPAQDWQSGLSEMTTDPALPGGFYWLFAPAGGSQRFTAAATGYTTAAATVDAAGGRVTRKDWTLTPASGG